VSVPFVEDDKGEEIGASSFKDVEILGFSKMGFGSGKTECQDTMTMLPQLTPNLHFFAVYDGHGIKGKDVSSFVNSQMSITLKKNASNIEKLATKDYMTTFFKTTFKVIENKLNHSSINTTSSGTCCVAVLISNGKCFVANLGDSRAVLCREKEDRSTITIELSQDHKPSREDEKARVIGVGGFVEPAYYNGMAIGPLRVWTNNKEGGIAVTRAMGDRHGRKAGIISEPEVTKFDLEEKDRFIIVASDGLWDVFTSEEAVAFVNEYMASGKAKSNLTRAMVREARKRWERLDDSQDDPYCDDITVVVAFLNFNTGATLMETPVKAPLG